MLNTPSTGEEDGTRQNIILAISLKAGNYFSFSLKKSIGPYFVFNFSSVEKFRTLKFVSRKYFERIF
jgi:hypothetical protein